MYGLVVLLSVFALALGAKLPSDFQTCKASDNACLREKMEDALPKLANGNKDLAIAQLDPFVYESLSVERKPGPISLSQKYTNVRLTGLSDSKVSKFALDLNGCKMSFEAMTPHLEVDAHYNLQGQLLVFPIDADGDLHAKQDNMLINNDLTCEKFEKDGDEYIRMVDLKVTFHFGDLKFQMGDIVKGNAQINDEIHKAINDDPLAFMETLKPSLEKIWVTTILDIANKIFEHVPLKDIFKD